MDEIVRRRTTPGAAIGCAWLLCACVCASLSAQAQPLQDPTRPALGALAPPRTEDAAQSAPGPRLQSVLIGRQPGGRQVAVIDGDTVRVGEMYKGARVARIEANQVELVRANTRQVLTLDSTVKPGTVRIEPTGKQ